MATKIDIHQQITDRIIAAIEAGTKPWQCDWFKQQQLRANGTPYRGINCLLLAIATGQHGFSSPHRLPRSHRSYRTPCIAWANWSAAS